MSSAAEVLTELERRGVRIALDGDTLSLKPRRVLDDALLARVREAKPAILEALRCRPATCSPDCYEVEPGRWIHRPWTGCTTIQPETGEPLHKVQETCWHCRGEKSCACIACWQAGPSECVTCKGSGQVWRWVQDPLELDPRSLHASCTETNEVSKTTEPIYSFIGNDETGAACCRYYCPHCNMEFFRKTPCVSHTADCSKSHDKLNRQLRKIEIERFLSDAKGEAECFEKIIAYEEEGIYAVCAPAVDGTWAIFSVRTENPKGR